MKLDIDWTGLLRAVVKAVWPFVAGAVGGLFAGCTVVHGSGALPARGRRSPYTGGLTSLHDLFGFPTRNKRLPSAGAEGSW